MYTSYFARLKEVKNPISICGRAPEWYQGPQYKLLAPKLWFFQLYKEGTINSEDYTEAYNIEVLGELDPHKVYKALFSAYDEEPTLLCYEKPGDFCHRHLVAAWLREAGYDIKELE